MVKNRRKLNWKLFLAELAILISGTAGMWYLGGIRQMQEDRLLSSSVLTLLGLAVTGFQFRREYLQDELDYNNGEHIFRFWLCMGVGLAVAFACGFLPAEGWPFLAVFVMLALFSNMQTGILASTVLLLIAVMLSGGSVDGFALYLISGVFAVTLFRRVESDFKFVVPLFLSVFCLLVCEMACLILTANARPEPEMFVIPVVNIIVSSVLLIGFLKTFSSVVVYQYRERYLDVNDTESPVLAELREKDRQEYMYGVHTAYFCERIANRLDLNADALKCAGYYHRLGDKLTEMIKEKQLPPTAVEILKEYQTKKERVTRKETAVLVCADLVITSVTYLLQKGSDRNVDFDKTIDAIFKKLWDDGSFNQSDLTFAEFFEIQRIFKEEKLYYDFLR